MRKYAAEYVGTFALVFAGCGAIIVSTFDNSGLNHFGVSTIFGLIVMAMIYSLGNVSGAHINPAVSLGFFAAGRSKFNETLFYIVSQVTGAISAALLLKFLFQENHTLGITTPSGTVLQSFILEIVLSFFLMFVILNVSTGHKEKGVMAGIAIGGTVALEALLGGSVSGASMNPARSIGPALVSGQMQYLWIYLTAPIIGMLLAHPVAKIIQADEYILDKQGDVNNG